MSYNFVNDATNIEVVNECLYDSSVGYEADFSVDGDVDGWDSFSLLHTYGVWNGFLFATLYGANAYMGRSNVFTPVAAETHYTVKISMKLNPTSGSLPTMARLMWRTLNDSSWDSDKTLDFTIYPDNIWHTYVLNMGTEQWWQGDVNDLRLYPLLDGDDGDEFFIRAIKIDSVSTFQCLNPTCSYYNNYSHPCQGIGKRAYCLADTTDSNYFDILSNNNDELIVNINGYGSEKITLASGTNISGDVLAKDLTKKISQVDIGGYAEANVTYSETGRFKIYSGTYSDDSTVTIAGGSAAETLGFDSFTSSQGEDPATGFRPKSSFKIKSFQLLELFDNSQESYIEFDPFIYNIEGGRRDWVENGLGTSTLISQPDEGYYNLVYGTIENENKTIIDFNHPFNASGKITKLYLVGTMVSDDGTVRTGCKIKIFRPNKSGRLKTIHTLDVPNRSGGKLYSKTQEYVVVDCDLLVNKGDIIGAYNIDIYVGKSYTQEPDALYYQVSGEALGTFDPGDLLGGGNAGFFFYGRGDDFQKKLHIDIDLGKRVNIEQIDIDGFSDSDVLEYNIARCLDLDWQVDLFGGTHDTGYWDSWNSWWVNYNHANVAYGKNNLTDGDYGNENGVAADGFSASDAGGVVPTNPHYFYVNGDEEWVGIHFHVGQYKSDPYVRNFDEDPIAFTINFPSNKNKTIFKSAIYFKERHNFRSFGLSYYLGPDITSGNADNPHYQYIPEYSAVTTDSVRNYEGSENYETVEAYLFNNPCDAKPDVVSNSIANYDEFMAAEVIDWNVIKHEFGPITCKGFRIYTDYHKSTKINEMELYAYVENEGTNIADSVGIRHSQYEDLWLDAEMVANDDGTASSFIGSTPQYFRIEVEPVNTIHLSDLLFTVSVDDVYVGEKGCEYKVLLNNTKRGTTNDANRIDFKNVYDKPFSLYVDIPKDAEYDKGLVFYSTLASEDAITEPEVGPGASFSKRVNYPLVLRDNNCAINCPVYGLKNLVDGKQTYWSLDGDYWEEYETAYSGISIDFSNFKSQTRTVINIPKLHTNRYWKIGFSCQDQTMNIREARIYEDGTLLSYTGYHDPGTAWLGPVSDWAPHLNNSSIVGSYYTLEDESYITFDLGVQKSVTKIVFYNDNTTTDYSNSGCGIDRYTQLCLHCDNVVDTTTFVDSSYFPKTVTARGNTYIDNNSYFGNGAARFDGTASTYLEVAEDDAWDFYNYRWTVDFWVKFNSPPQEQTDWCHTVSGTGNGTGDIFDVTDHDRNTYFLMNSGSVTVDWGVVQPVDAVYIRYRPTGHFSQGFSGKLENGTWESFSYGGGSGAWGIPGDGWYLTSRKYYSAIRVVLTGSTSELYDVRAIMLDRDKDVILAANWGSSSMPHLGKIVQDGNPSSDESWVLFWRNYGNFYTLEFYVAGYRSSWGWDYFGKQNVRSVPASWAHLAVCYGRRDSSNTYYSVYINGSRINALSQETQANYIRDTNNPLIFGENLDGWLDEIRVSVGDEYLPSAGTGKGGSRYTSSDFTPFTHAYERFYGMSVYTSLNNVVYGHYCDLDIKYEVDDPGVYYYAGNYWSSTFNAYFAIDLGRRYDLQLLRNYAGTNLLACSLTNYTNFSADDVSNANSVSYDGTYEDARWIRFRLYSGDSNDRYIRKLGIYPAIDRYIAPPGGSYNHNWDSLGSSITTYTEGKNVALGSTVSGSSYFGELYLGKITDGIVGDEPTDVWGSDTSGTQWVEISFDDLYSIYKVKMYHGYSEDDSNYIIEDYNIQVSTDGSTYTTIFDITGNSDFEREHVLSSPVNARSLKINITGYSTGDAIYLPQGGDSMYAWFQGAMLREVEVYQYYGFGYISSEEYPIIAIDLLDQFQLSDHSLVGLDPEDTTTDWSNAESNFAYADSVLSDPKKITFSSWGSGHHVHHDRWVAIRRDTATNYNDGPDYLRHAKIIALEDPNPCEYYWWWSSNISTLSNSYSMVKECVRSLKVEYTTVSGIEHLYLIEGDTFGIDVDVAWRDALHFWMYVDDIDSLDDYGYVYFGNASSADYVEYRWSFSFLKQYMSSGWTDMFLRFKSATDIAYVEDNDPDAADSRILANRELKSLGMYFRGSAPMTMYLDGFEIERNKFNDYGKFDFGTYLHGSDYITAPLADFKLTQGAVEFWLRPDYDAVGVDYFNDFKYRSLFHFSNVVNDVFGAMIGLGGFLVYVGNLPEELLILSVEANYWEIDDLFHLAFVYSNDGTSIGSDGSTVRLYMNNYLLSKITDTWEVNDSKKFNFIIGGKSLHAVKEGFESASVDGVMADFKIHNYCKTDFSDSVGASQAAKERLWKPNELIEISKNNVTFYRVGDPNLPLIYENVPVGNTVSTYVRASLPDTLRGTEAREASILASWFVSV
jgi:hypothetical protein